MTDKMTRYPTHTSDIDIEIQRKAAVAIAGRARDVEDARLLLEALGFLPYDSYYDSGNRNVNYKPMIRRTQFSIGREKRENTLKQIEVT